MTFQRRHILWKRFSWCALVLLLCALAAAQKSNPDHVHLNVTASNCSAVQFQCGSGQCIPKLYLCDGDKDCSGEGEDENPIYCSGYATHCDYGRTKCTEDGSCIRVKHICDGIIDCPNGSDESNCTCSPLHYRCLGGECIPDSWLCDGDVDCEVQGDDEDIKHCNGTCRPDTTKCAENNHCIHFTQICNGINNCVNGSDEMNCDCPEGQFRCIGGDCIPDSWLCDGYRDCGYWGDDENLNNCNGTCRPGRVKCAESNYCLLTKYVCDGENDCLHGSDEEHCSSTSATEISPTSSMQPNVSISTESTRIPSTSTKLIVCQHDEFQCISGRCLPGLHLCDGHRDCELGEDETRAHCKGSENDVPT